jgi:hypothetical protein
MGHGPLSGVGLPNDRIWEMPMSPTGQSLPFAAFGAEQI